MQVKKTLNRFILTQLISTLIYVGVPSTLYAADKTCFSPKIDLPASDATLKETIVQKLGWITTNNNRCGGYYLEPAFLYPKQFTQNDVIKITSDQTLFAQHGTSILEGQVTITQMGQQITANKAYLYRDSTTGKYNAIDLIGRVHFREPDDLIVAKDAHIDLVTKTQTLNNIYYRSAIYGSPSAKPERPDNDVLQKPRKVTQLSAWGEAKTFTKIQPKVYEFKEATYSTCPPTSNTWQIRASKIKLDKNSGRGTARNGRLYIKNIPILYAPYLNFPIDARRETGFLAPVFGSGRSGGYLSTPFYLNMAPNYDSTITPSYMTKRGFQVTDLFRYMTKTMSGQAQFQGLPSDKEFTRFQTVSQAKYGNSTDPVVLADLKRLQNEGSARGAFYWRNKAQFNPNWSSDIDYNYTTDDYFLRDLGHSLNEVTDNQLLQQGEVNYKQQHWNLTTRVQQYQTLHPVDVQSVYLNQYSRFPQFIVNGDYPDQKFGLDYFIANDLTHFDYRDTPGVYVQNPMGNRLHIQPGVSLPVNWPSFYMTPRLQFAMTNYELGHITNVETKTSNRTLPIFDLGTGLYFDRDMQFFGENLHQTLEPQAYYTYIPYRVQDQIPLFDTTLNTLTYDQLFTYNRFSGLDRFGDANQIALGVTTRLIDPLTGAEKIRASLGQLIYFRDRRVTLCSVNDPGCPTPAMVSLNAQRRSPLSSALTYTLNPQWTLSTTNIWNTQKNQIMNQATTLQYKPGPRRAFNLGYNFVRDGDALATDPPNSPQSNLKQLNFSVAWPVLRDWSAVASWTKSINRGRFQSMVYGLQYDNCCWAVRAVAGRAFLNLGPTGNPVYNNQAYVEVALKGLSNFGPFGDPSQLVSSSVPGYENNFGHDF